MRAQPLFPLLFSRWRNAAYKYQAEFNYYDLLKLIALVTMIVDHVGAYVFPDAEWMRAVGRIAAPIFLFLVGYSGNFAVRRDLFYLGMAVALCAFLTRHPFFPMNILVTILVCRAIMGWLVAKQFLPRRGHEVVIVLFFWSVIFFFFVDYGVAAMLLCLAGYMRRQLPQSKGWTYFAVAMFLLHFATQGLFFDFSFSDQIIMWVGAILDLWLLMNLGKRRFSLPAFLQPYRVIMLYFSRNTLDWYALHIIALYILSMLLCPQQHAVFRLM